MCHCHRGLQEEMVVPRRLHDRQYRQQHAGLPHSLHGGSDMCHVDAVGHHPYDDLLWPERHLCPMVPAHCLCHLFAGLALYRFVVDYDSHRGCGSDGHWPHLGHQRWLGGRCHHIGCLFRRQDLPIERNDQSGIVDGWCASVRPHTQHDEDHRAEHLGHNGCVHHRRSAVIAFSRSHHGCHPADAEPPARYLHHFALALHRSSRSLLPYI